MSLAIGTLHARRAGVAGLLLLSLGSLAACSGTGGLGSILGSVLGGGQSGQQQVSGTIQGVDTRSRQIGIRQSNGQTVAVSYDNQTQVVFQNQNYPVTALENGDQVTLRIQSANNGGYYTDLVQVDQSVSGSSAPGRMGGRGGSAGSTGGSVQSLQGSVRQVDHGAGWFIVDTQDGQRLAVSMPSSLSRADYDRFQRLRAGDYVRLYYSYLGNNRIELRQFY